METMDICWRHILHAPSSGLTYNNLSLDGGQAPRGGEGEGEEEYRGRGHTLLFDPPPWGGGRPADTHLPKVGGTPRGGVPRPQNKGSLKKAVRPWQPWHRANGRYRELVVLQIMIGSLASVPLPSDFGCQFFEGRWYDELLWRCRTEATEYSKPAAKKIILWSVCWQLKRHTHNTQIHSLPFYTLT